MRAARRIVLPLLALVVLAAACNVKVRLPSAGPTFGNVVASLDNTTSCPSYQAVTVCNGTAQPLIWAAINGPYTNHADGDPYATKCDSTGSGTAAACNDPSAPNGAKNPRYRPTGYAYGIDVSKADAAADVPLTLYGYDLESSARYLGTNATVTLSNGTVVPTDCRTTLSPFNSASYSGMTTQHCQTGDGGPGNLDVEVFDNDGTDNKVAFDTPLDGCRVTIRTTDDVTAYRNRWYPICTIEHPRAGIYPLRVRSSAIPGVTDAGSSINAFSLAVGGSSSSRLAALDEVSTWYNSPGSVARMALAEVVPAQAGKKLRIDLYDVGDGSSGAYTLYVRGPGGQALPAANIATGCTYNAVPSVDAGPPTPDVSTTCGVMTRNPSAGSPNLYNDRWLRIEVQLDPHYSCGGAVSADCWWQLLYSFGGASLPSDRLTYRASVV